MAEPLKLSTKLEGKFKMSPGYGPGKYVHGNVSIDLSTCSVAQADAFIKAGAEVISRVEPPVTKRV
ncbi:MAG: hypothetical protein A3F72_02995 [Bacteroidetes bacterium RIFCSPLOWO2_12_FULL_35_15]|nr:MAG: hypothetical protein A3F72_02995 [Bacteroidetes bacterium RIFCSPLOWO2_12_FULL_35_15]